MDEEQIKGMFDAFENRISASVAKQLEDFSVKMQESTAKCDCGGGDGEKADDTKMDSEEIIMDAASDIVAAVEDGAGEMEVESMVEDAVVQVVDEIIAEEEGGMMEGEEEKSLSPQQKGAIKRRVRREMKAIVKTAQSSVGDVTKAATDPRVGELEKEVAQMRESAALRNDEDWIDGQMAVGKVTPDEKSTVLKSLKDARQQDGMIKSGGNMHTTIKAMIESKEENLVNAVTASNLRIAGFASPNAPDTVDTDYLKRITGGAYNG